MMQGGACRTSSPSSVMFSLDEPVTMKISFLFSACYCSRKATTRQCFKAGKGRFPPRKIPGLGQRSVNYFWMSPAAAFRCFWRSGPNRLAIKLAYSALRSRETIAAFRRNSDLESVWHGPDAARVIFYINRLNSGPFSPIQEVRLGFKDGEWPAVRRKARPDRHPKEGSELNP